MKIGDDSPWGPIQSIYNYGPILHITTAGHGGFYVPASLYKEIPNYAKKTAYSSGGFCHLPRNKLRGLSCIKLDV